jgi:hypothetical protein
MTTSPVQKKLEDQGTRFRHLADLQDFIGDGLFSVENSAYRNTQQNLIRKNFLGGILSFITAYQESLALDKHGRNYGQQKFDQNRLIDANVPTKAALDAMRLDLAGAKNPVPETPAMNPDPTPNPEDDGLTSV